MERIKSLWKKKWLRRWVYLFAFLFGLFIFRNPILRGVGSYLVSDDPLTRCDAFFVLGGNSFERGEAAIDVYHKLPHSRFVTTGGNYPLQIRALDTMMTEAALTRHFMIKKEVPDSLISILEKSTSTFEESDEILGYCQNQSIDTITLISSTFHLRRMRWVFEKKFAKYGIVTYFHGAADSEFEPTAWWKDETGLITCNNEYMKLLYYLVKY